MIISVTSLKSNKGKTPKKPIQARSLFLTHGTLPTYKGYLKRPFLSLREVQLTRFSTNKHTQLSKMISKDSNTIRTSHDILNAYL